jgi:putative addiction module component (TIGR02574 family)
MSPSLEQLKVAVSELSVDERAELARYLLEMPDGAEESIRAEWLALAEHRMAEVRAGRPVGIPAEEVLGKGQ